MSVADGLKRIVRSAKVQLSATVLATAAVALVTAPGDFASKRDLWRDFLYAGIGLIGVCVASWAWEDSAAAKGPAQQVNVQSDVKNPLPATPPQDARPVEPAPKPEPTKAATIGGKYTMDEVVIAMGMLGKRLKALEVQQIVPAPTPSAPPQPIMPPPPNQP